ncbi:hypothetical protein EKO27_g11118 [Xylaria grammica]|uniref:Transcription factor domain-containing protein n=1 Tax=Xylaria grammica TaxID=363999 RepID=A0A439CPB5_9PEZI|nr:hypothetical protein EKO27_g11118 [Xylaria grammica]
MGAGVGDLPGLRTACYTRRRGNSPTTPSPSLPLEWNRDARVGPHESQSPEEGGLLKFNDIIDARLFRQYVHRIDISDRQCHFGIEVPRRAHKFPLLSYGMMAFASAVSVSPERAAVYHNQAVDILITILDGPIESLDENVLAAIVLLRAFEEGTDTDMGTHLFGSARLLNTASGFASAGASGRQLAGLRSSAFTSVDAESLANRAVFICAQVLTFAFGTGQGVPEWPVDEWDTLNEELETWYGSRPGEMCAFWVDVPQGGEAVGITPGFPTAWIARPVHGGSYLNDPKEQREALAFLEKFEIESTWKADHIAENLRNAWSMAE